MGRPTRIEVARKRLSELLTQIPSRSVLNGVDGRYFRPPITLTSMDDARRAFHTMGILHAMAVYSVGQVGPSGAYTVPSDVRDMRSQLYGAAYDLWTALLTQWFEGQATKGVKRTTARLAASADLSSAA